MTNIENMELDENFLKRISIIDNDRNLKHKFRNTISIFNDHLVIQDRPEITNLYDNVNTLAKEFVHLVLECMDDENDMNVPDDVIEFYNEYFAEDGEEFASDDDGEEFELALDRHTEREETLDKAFSAVELISEMFNNLDLVDQIADVVGISVDDTRKIICVLQRKGVCGARSPKLGEVWKRAPTVEFDYTIGMNIIERDSILAIFKPLEKEEESEEEKESSENSLSEILKEKQEESATDEIEKDMPKETNDEFFEKVPKKDLHHMMENIIGTKEVQTEISTPHKEMLIEILYKLIV